jgi:hypothetical protein
MGLRRNRVQITSVLDEVLAEIRELLLSKNASYGNSALQPIGIFARGNPIEQIDVRIDDKLNRIKNGHEFHGEDTIKDLIGYLILRLVVTKLLENTLQSNNPRQSGTDSQGGRTFKR